MGKAKDGSECFTKTTKGGGKYVTCTGAQDKRVARAKLKSGGDKAPMVKKAGKGTGGLKKKLGATKIAKPEVAKGRVYDYKVYLPEDYSDTEALAYWKKSKLGSMKSGVELSKELTAEGGRPIFDKGTYHVFTARRPYTIAEWKSATKGRPTGFVSETGKNYGYTGGIVKKVKNL